MDFSGCGRGFILYPGHSGDGDQYLSPLLEMDHAWETGYTQFAKQQFGTAKISMNTEMSPHTYRIYH